jgi:polyisoprenoid-binding protein YceI
MKVACLILMGAVWLAHAEEIEWRIDPAQTTVEFTLGATLHTVRGTFRLTRGSIRLDTASGKASGELVVDAASGESGNRDRDRDMHKKVLESERYPEIVFRLERVEGAVAPTGTSQVQVHGKFSIHGGEHELSAPVTVEAAGGQYIVTARFTAPYVKWGMKNPSKLLLRVSDKVQITIRAVAQPAAAGSSQARQGLFVEPEHDFAALHQNRPSDQVRVRGH